MTDAFPDLSTLLNPVSIAVVGASDKPGNVGRVAIRLLQTVGYPGDVWAINPTASTVSGVPCYSSLAEAPTPGTSLRSSTPRSRVASVSGRSSVILRT